MPFRSLVLFDTKRLPRLRRKGLALLALAASLASCDRSTEPPTPVSDAALGRDFLPVSVGRFWVYDVTERVWNFNSDSVTRFQLRERIDTIFTGADGEPTYRVISARRPDAASPWIEDTAFALVVTPQIVRRTQANRPILELLFPVKEGLVWNPNLFNALVPTDRQYAKLDQSVTLPTGQQFARTVRVEDAGENNLFYLRESVSTYARSVGRISRERRTLDFCQYNDSVSNGCTTGPGFIVRGNERLEYLTEYGPLP